MNKEAEAKYFHARISKENAAKLKKIAEKSGRTLNKEANMAIEIYKPLTINFEGNGQ